MASKTVITSISIGEYPLIPPEFSGEIEGDSTRRVVGAQV